MSDYLIVINPGSTTTKMALFDGPVKMAETFCRHDPEELAAFDNVADQFEYRMTEIDRWIESLSINQGELKAVVGRGAPLRPLDVGSFLISDQMIDDLRNRRYSNHASNLGPIIARHLGERFGVPSLITDPITVDNFTDVARVSGFPGIERRCRAHTLMMR